MGYDAAIGKAWQQIAPLEGAGALEVKFLGETYTADPGSKVVFSRACNVHAKEYLAILILHYLASAFKRLPPLRGEWVSFKELPGGESYYSAFRKRAIEPLIRKYGAQPEGLIEAAQRLGGRPAREGDASITLEVFEGVPVLAVLWKGDEEFAPEASLLFDRSISEVFCTEDVAVLAGILAARL